MKKARKVSAAQSKKAQLARDTALIEKAGIVSTPRKAPLKNVGDVNELYLGDSDEEDDPTTPAEEDNFEKAATEDGEGDRNDALNCNCWLSVTLRSFGTLLMHPAAQS